MYFLFSFVCYLYSFQSVRSGLRRPFPLSCASSTVFQVFAMDRELKPVYQLLWGVLNQLAHFLKAITIAYSDLSLFIEKNLFTAKNQTSNS